MEGFSADVKLHDISALCGFMNQHLPVLEGISGVPEHQHRGKRTNNNYQRVQDVFQTKCTQEKIICIFFLGTKPNEFV